MGSNGSPDRNTEYPERRRIGGEHISRIEGVPIAGKKIFRVAAMDIDIVERDTDRSDQRGSTIARECGRLKDEKRCKDKDAADDESRFYLVFPHVICVNKQ